jgi:mycothiol synthase
VESLANDWTVGLGYEPERDTVILEADRRVIGGARHSWREREGAIVHRIEVWVRPSERRRGHGRRLLAWAEARAREAAAEGTGGPAGASHFFGGFTGVELPASVAFSEAMGYAPIRFHVEMRRPIAGPIPDAPLPEGLEVRPVLPDHHRAIWDADAEAFEDHWDHAAVTEDDFVRFYAEPHIDTSLWQVAWDGDEVAGLVINAIVPHENAQRGTKVGWLDSVATRRPWRRRGVGGALIARSLRVLGGRGMEIAALGVDTQSPTGALSLYESFGFRPERTWMFLRKPF